MSTIKNVDLDKELESLKVLFLSHHPAGDVSLIERAFSLASDAHKDQMRQSGDPYIVHPIGVAYNVAKLGLDATAIAAALCHDTVEDCDITLEDLQRELGDEVARMVDGVTKLDKVKTSVARGNQSAEMKAATLRKLLVAVASDVKVLIIKLCDRLNNVETLGILPPAKAQRIAAETLEVYAPLAHRLGMGEIKWQLEDKSFAALYPERYKEIVALVESRSPERDRQVAMAVDMAKKALHDAEIEAQVDGRAKHYWSIYSKMTRRGKTFDEIFDLLGIRVIVEGVKECYGALGVLHSLYPPVPGRFKDYIAQPKFNSYAALHSTVVGPEGKMIELQIRTQEMHSRAESGIAAHWSYKTGGVETPQGEPSWLKRLLETQVESDDPNIFMENIRQDLAEEEVVCFTPKGEALSLPSGSKPLDFAYLIHTELGHRAVGAKVNGRLVPLSTILKTGDAVEIIVSKEADPVPRANWLSLVNTARARGAIRARLNKSNREEHIQAGKAELSKALRAEKLPSAKTLKSPELTSVASSMHFTDIDGLLAAIGIGDVDPKSVIRKLRAINELSQGVKIVTPQKAGSLKSGKNSEAGLHAEGLTDLVLRIANCCSPTPGDPVMGYITRGRGISVHREDCTNVPALLREKARCIEVEWTRASAKYLVKVEIEGLDRPGLVADVTRVVADMGGNIQSCQVNTGSDMVAHQHYEFELSDTEHLEKLLEALSLVEGVYSARREMSDA